VEQRQGGKLEAAPGNNTDNPKHDIIPRKANKVINDLPIRKLTPGGQQAAKVPQE